MRVINSTDQKIIYGGATNFDLQIIPVIVISFVGYLTNGSNKTPKDESPKTLQYKKTLANFIKTDFLA